MKAIFGLAAVAVLTAVSAQAQEGSGEANGDWAGIVQCAAIDRAEARHACMDEVIRRAGLLSEARVTQAARADFGNENRAAPASAAPAPVPAAAAPSPVPSAAAAPKRADDLDELVTTVASAQVRGDRRLVVTTAEGSVWEQTQSETFRSTPKAGSPFSIERAAMGGFRCSFERSTHYRCRRID